MSSLPLFLVKALSVWRRNLQLRLVLITLGASAIVIGIVGALLLNQVVSGILDAKQKAASIEASAAKQEIQNLLDATETGIDEPNVTRLVDSVITALAIRAGTPGIFDALFLSDPSITGAPQRGTKLVAESSIPMTLRESLGKNGKQAWIYGKIDYEDGTRVTGIIVGNTVAVPNVGQYELYLLFPLKNEQNSVNLVRSGVAVTGLALLMGLGVLALFVTAHVTEPVRRVAEVAEEFADGDLDRRLNVHGEDDMARLAGSFNKMADSLQSQITRLETLSFVQQQFVSDVSHELRTPLTTVRMASELIYNARSKFDPETARCAELLQRQVERFFHLLNDLLEISRFDAGAGALEASTIDLVALTRDIVENDLRIATAHETELSFDSGQTYAFIEGDSRRIGRIVRNLVANAIEHSEGKPVEVKLRSSDEAVSISVRDSGLGLSEENLERVFGRFWRADPSRARTLGGSGLGLSISMEDAQLHGGNITVWGRPNRGAQFVLTLPRRVNASYTSAPIQASDVDA